VVLPSMIQAMYQASGRDRAAVTTISKRGRIQTLMGESLFLKPLPALLRREGRERIRQEENSGEKGGEPCCFGPRLAQRVNPAVWLATAL